MRGLVTTMFEKIESMKKFDAHESQFWRNLSSPSNIIRSDTNTIGANNNNGMICSAQKSLSMRGVGGVSAMGLNSEQQDLIPMEDIDIAVQAQT